MKSDATKQTAHTMATVRNEARTPMADAAASGTPVRMAAAVCVFMMVTSSTVQWLTTGFMLTNGIMIPITAFLIETFTTRQLFLYAMGIFAE